MLIYSKTNISILPEFIFYIISSYIHNFFYTLRKMTCKISKSNLFINLIKIVFTTYVSCLFQIIVTFCRSIVRKLRYCVGYISQKSGYKINIKCRILTWTTTWKHDYFVFNFGWPFTYIVWNRCRCTYKSSSHLT